MERKMDAKNIQPYPLGSQALVIGSGITGLSAARVLVNYFDQVTIIDRDQLPATPGFRLGVPQAYHAHTLLPLGQILLEHLFPGFVGQLLDEGAEMIDAQNETLYYERGIWQRPEPNAARSTISCSRPMLENLLYRRITELPQVHILSGHEAVEFVVSEGKDRIAGITVRSR